MTLWGGLVKIGVGKVQKLKVKSQKFPVTGGMLTLSPVAGEIPP